MNPAQAEKGKLQKEIEDLFSSLIGASAYGQISAQVGDAGGGAGATTGIAPVLAADAPDLLKKLVDKCDEIAAHKTFYGHEGHDLKASKYPIVGDFWEFDCSSFVSHVLSYIGKLGSTDTQVSGWFCSSRYKDVSVFGGGTNGPVGPPGGWGVAGEGKYLTVWSAGDHVFLEIKGNNGSKCIGTSGMIQDQNSGGPHGHYHTVGWLSNYPKTGPGGSFEARHIEGF
jgi:hypothetical protein